MVAVSGILNPTTKYYCESVNLNCIFAACILIFNFIVSDTM